VFSLIITIVSIALVVALVAATMYHGGDTLTQGRTTADAAAFVTGAQQIGAAVITYESFETKRLINGVERLVEEKYLASAPVVKSPVNRIWSVDPTGRIIRHQVASNDVCKAINKSAGVPEATIATGTVAAADLANRVYGCLTADNTFQFKF